MDGLYMCMCVSVQKRTVESKRNVRASQMNERWNEIDETVSKKYDAE